MIQSEPHLKHAAKKAQETLKGLTIGDLLKHKREHVYHPLLALPQETPIRDFLKILAEKGYLSAPIYKTTPTGDRIYTGMVSTDDVLSTAIFEQVFDSQEEFDEVNFFDFLERVNVKQFFNSPISKLIGATGESASPWILYSTDSLLDLVLLFTKHRQHRALVIDADILKTSIIGPVPASASLSLVSQTDVARFIHSSKLGETPLPKEVVEPLLDVTLSALPHLGGAKSTMAMMDYHSALHGFRTMYLDSLQGLPVINKYGQVVANLSASDMRGLTVDTVKNVTLPVFDYLQSIPRPDQELKPDQLRSIDKESTLELALSRILKNKIHRLWITEDLETLRGVVSLTDVLRLFANTV